GEHVIFTAWNRMEGTLLRVVCGDEFKDVIEHGGVVTSVTYLMPRFVDDVVRYVDGVRLRLDPGGELRAVPEAQSEFATWRDAWKVMRSWRSGLMDADPAELRLVLTRLRGAERFDSAG